MFKGKGQSDLLMKFKIISLYNMIAVSVWLPRKQTDSLKQNIVNVNVNMCQSFRALNKHHSNKKRFFDKLRWSRWLNFLNFPHVIREQRSSIEQG